ncbi:MAG: YggS family pyridoxal phosphate-dependent enzyme [Myxococcota bacterium]
MSELSARLADVRAHIESAAQRAGREVSEIRLVAVSKTFPAEAVLEAVTAGLDRFGENRVQEAAHKRPQVSAKTPRPLRWHLVGSLQRNKVRRALELFEVIESVDRLELAHELERGAARLGVRPAVLIQVNIDREPQKAGFLPEELAGAVERIAALDHLNLCGLMTLPRACKDPERVRPSFTRLRELLEHINRGRTEGRRLRELSMGMSADFEVAIEEGATTVRIGSAIFGERRRG